MLGLAAMAASTSPALADDTNFFQSNTQYGVSLPNASLSTGSDEVRAADGTSCRSAVGGNGAYVDTGVIGSPGQGSTDFSGAVYTRLVVPLGGGKRRLDCSSLYELEIQRLKMELDLARMGLSGRPPDWQEEGWSNEGAIHKPAVATAPIKKVAKTAERKISVQPVPAADTPVETSLVITADSIY
jgi:hypothetical protein